VRRLPNLLFQLVLYLPQLIATLLRPVLSRVSASQKEETEYAYGDVHNVFVLDGCCRGLCFCARCQRP
jgi:hypothetical protein